MSTKDENSDNEFYDACENPEKLSDDEEFVSVIPTQNEHERPSDEAEKKFVPLHEELNQKMNLAREKIKEEHNNDDDVDDEVVEIKQDDDPFFVDENQLKDEQLTDETKQERLSEALEYKKNGNDLYKQDKFLEALDLYTKALRVCPFEFSKDRSVFYSNRSLCFLKMVLKNFEKKNLLFYLAR